MSVFYVPFKGDKPVTTLINGHRLVILSTHKTTFEGELKQLGATRLRKFTSGSTEGEQVQVLNEIGREANSGVVVAPAEAPITDVIKSLEAELPWLH